jgi:hypothetical protein
MYKDDETKKERDTPDFLVTFSAKIFICVSTAVCLRKLSVGTEELCTIL